MSNKKDEVRVREVAMYYLARHIPTTNFQIEDLEKVIGAMIEFRNDPKGFIPTKEE